MFAGLFIGEPVTPLMIEFAYTAILVAELFGPVSSC